jgi:hypothetical protein
LFLRKTIKPEREKTMLIKTDAHANSITHIQGLIDWSGGNLLQPQKPYSENSHTYSETAFDSAFLLESSLF